MLQIVSRVKRMDRNSQEARRGRLARAWITLTVTACLCVICRSREELSDPGSDGSASPVDLSDRECLRLEVPVKLFDSSTDSNLVKPVKTGPGGTYD